jgi:carboxymethylenebutenolidase
MMAQRDLTPSQQAMVKTLAEHGKAEFHDRDLEATLATMTEHPYLFFVPTLAGGEGRAGVRDFYRGMMGQLPPDFQVTPVTDTVGRNRIVRELLVTFTHSVAMDWLVPGIAPTGKRVEMPLILIFTFHGEKVASERLYWDQASLLMQLGVLDPGSLPITGMQSVQKLLQLTKADG